MQGPTVISILVVGEPGCGKSTFLSRLTVRQTAATGGNDATPQLLVLKDSNQPFLFNVRLHGVVYRLEFYDTSYPHQHWTGLKPDIVVLAFDIADRKSLEKLGEWRDDITRHIQNPEQESSPQRENIPIMILGLKRDLRVENETIIYPQEAYRVAQELRCDRYAECSAITGELIPEVFEDIAMLAEKRNTESGGQTQGGCLLM